MDLTDEQIVAILMPLIPEEKIDEAAIYIDTRMKVEGAHLQLGNREHVAPFAGYFIFVDLMPKANWGHPAKGVFISPKGDKVYSIDTEFPPFFGDPPETFRRLSV